MKTSVSRACEPFLEPLPAPVISRVRLQADAPEIIALRGDMCLGGTWKSFSMHGMLCDALRRGELRAGGTVADATSGGAGLAAGALCPRARLRCVLFIPEGTSPILVQAARLLGAKVYLTPASNGMQGAMAAVEQAAQKRGWFLLRQFDNSANPDAYRRLVVPYVLRFLQGNSVDAVVCGSGTGGTLAGLAQGFADAGQTPAVYLARPIADGQFSTRIPGLVSRRSSFLEDGSIGLVKEVDVADEEAIAVTKRLIKAGYPVGLSSGVNFLAAVKVARLLGPRAQVVTVFPDAFWRYLTAGVLAGGGRTDKSRAFLRCKTSCQL